MAQHPAQLKLSSGQRVRLRGTRRWGQVAPWPTGVVEDIRRLERTHLPVTGAWAESESYQYWPLKDICLTDRDDEPPLAKSAAAEPPVVPNPDQEVDDD